MLVWQAFITSAGAYSWQEGAEENVLITSCIRLFVELTILLQPTWNCARNYKDYGFRHILKLVLWLSSQCDLWLVQLSKSFREMGFCSFENKIIWSWDFPIWGQIGKKLFAKYKEIRIEIELVEGVHYKSKNKYILQKISSGK